ncbi:MAG: DUF1565 domain-containing protein [Planctomycetes bacterium]|nr:DUF1565 domain-containing protein [Planctomycetota bacterium]
MKNITLIVVAILFLAGSNSEVLAKEYFVAKLGDDSKDGSSRETAFATIQKGVDALSPGDILTIAPGEYHESLKRIDLGNLEKETVIRAAIPGTVVLRGDLPVSSFRQVPKSRFVYVADLKTMSEVPVVNEIDTLTIFKRMPNASELEFIPGSFHHDAAAGKLYISTSDMKPPQTHHYSASVISTHGIYFVRPRRVTIEGIAMTGFSTMKLLHYREQTAGSVWGMFLVDPKSCVVRDCRAYLNGWGIGMGSYAITSGDNIIEHRRRAAQCRRRRE